MKRIIVIVLILILVAGGGAGALIMLGIVPNPFAPAQKEMSASEKAAAEADKKKFQPPLSNYVLIKFNDDLIIPVIINGQVKKRVYLTGRVMARGPDAKGAIDAKMGRFQNEVICDLLPFFQDYFLTHQIVDLQLLKDKLVFHAKKVYGDDAKDVLLTDVFEQAGGR